MKYVETDEPTVYRAVHVPRRLLFSSMECELDGGDSRLLRDEPNFPDIVYGYALTLSEEGYNLPYLRKTIFANCRHTAVRGLIRKSVSAVDYDWRN